MSSCNGSKLHSLRSLPFLKALFSENERSCRRDVLSIPKTSVITPFHYHVVPRTKTKGTKEFPNPTNDLLKPSRFTWKTSCLLNFHQQLLITDLPVHIQNRRI